MHRSWLGLGLFAVCVVAACAVGTSGADDTNGSPDANVNGDATTTQSDGGTTKDAATTTGDSSTCNSPMQICGDAGCVDTTSNVDHCGACTTACTTADAGALVANSNDNPDSGIPNYTVDAGAPWSLGTAGCAKSACGITCPSGLTLCSDDICYDTQNFHEHCGGCGTACAANEYCGGGHCCAQGSAYCNGACTDVLSNSSDCGGCGVVCTSGETCSGGQCVTCGNTNEALTATATSSGGGQTQYGYGPGDLNDGVLETTSSCASYNWANTSGGSTTEWVQYTWTSAHTLTSVHVDTAASANDTCSDTNQTATGAEIQWWNGSAWVTDGTVSGQTNDWSYTFTQPVSTTEVRLYSIRSKSGYNAFIWEWQVFGCN